MANFQPGDADRDWVVRRHGLHRQRLPLRLRRPQHLRIPDPGCEFHRQRWTQDWKEEHHG